MEPGYESRHTPQPTILTTLYRNSHGIQRIEDSTWQGLLNHQNDRFTVLSEFRRQHILLEQEQPGVSLPFFAMKSKLPLKKHGIREKAQSGIRQMQFQLPAPSLPSIMGVNIFCNKVVKISFCTYDIQQTFKPIVGTQNHDLSYVVDMMNWLPFILPFSAIRERTLKYLTLQPPSSDNEKQADIFRKLTTHRRINTIQRTDLPSVSCPDC